MKNLVQFQMSFDNVEVRSDDQSIIIKWTASTPKIDRYKSIITTDAIKNWMENYVKNPVILLGHDSSKAIWQMIEHTVDNTGLHVTVKLVNNVENVFENIRNWITKGFSIGFIALKWDYKTKEGIPLQSLTSEQLDELDYGDVIREINKIDLVEISVVNTPANPDSLFTLSRALNKFFEENEKRSFFTTLKRDTEEVIEDTKEVEETIEEVQEEVQEEVKGELPEVEHKAVEDDEDNEDISGEEVESADENTAIVETANDETPTEETKDIEWVYKVLDKVLDTLETVVNENAELKRKLSNIPVNKWFKTIPAVEKKESEPNIVQTLRQAKREALSQD